MTIRKRDGSLEPLDIKNITKHTIPAHEGLNLDHERLELEASISFTDEMKSTDIQEIFIQTAKRLVDVDVPNYTYIAARLILYDLYHNMKRKYFDNKVSGQVYDAISISKYLDLNEDILNYNRSLFEEDELQAYIEPDRDLLLTSLAIETLISRYLFRKEGEVTELPQHMWMSLAMFLAQNEDNPTEKAKEFYDVMSKLEYLPATPTLTNGRKIDGNCFSCAIGTTADNIEDIFDTYKTQALGSKNGAGWGWDWTRVRALGGRIKDIDGAAGGIIPWLKIENDLALAVDQLGTRLGAIAVYVETWHKDFFDFLDLKKNSGEDKRRAKELFIAASCSDEFMNRVKYDQTWTMFDPHDTPHLTEVYGETFSELYLAYEEKFRTNPESFTNEPVVVKAKDLYKKIQNLYFETGQPFLFFKDNANNQHQNPEIGHIRSSNLCTEIMEPTDDNIVALCNLGSINLSIVNTEEDIARVVPIAMRMLDNVIDLTVYAIPNSEENQKFTRAVGLGVCGEAEWIANKQIMYGSEEHQILLDELYSCIAKYSDSESEQLGKERGTWSPNSIYRNAYRRAIAPTSTVSILMGTSAMHEPVFNKVWIEENKMGAFKVTAPDINPDNFNFYINAYDVDQEDLVRCTAIRQKYIDQGISHNIYFRPGTSGKKVFDTIMLAWELGLKSTYYLRSDSLESLKDTRLEEIACTGCAG